MAQHRPISITLDGAALDGKAVNLSNLSTREGRTFAREGVSAIFSFTATYRTTAQMLAALGLSRWHFMTRCAHIYRWPGR